MKKLKKLFETPQKAVITVVCILAVLVIAGSGTVFVTNVIAKNLSIGEENAKNYAFADAGVDPASVGEVYAEFDFEHGTFVYEVEFIAAGIGYEYLIKASDGRVLEKKMESKVPAGDNSGEIKLPAHITDGEAVEKALADAGLNASDVILKKVVLELEDGISVYDIEFYTSTHEYEYEINASTGAVFSRDIELRNNGQPVNDDRFGNNQSGNNQSGNNPGNQDNPGTGANRISPDEAKKAALSDAGVSAADVTYIKEELDYEDGVAVYDIEFYTSTHEYEYEINASTGAVLSRDIELRNNGQSGNNPSGNNQSGNNPGNQDNPGTGANRISPDEAKKAALSDAGVSAADVTYIKEELDYEDGVAVYDIEFYTSTHEYEYEINASTGAVLSRDIELRNNGQPVNNDRFGDYIGLEEAKSVALRHAGFSAAEVSSLKAKSDDHHGQNVYEVEFYKNGREYEYKIDAATGSIVEYEVD